MLMRLCQHCENVSFLSTAETSHPIMIPKLIVLVLRSMCPVLLQWLCALAVAP
eukprot:m.546824 g.546824  ORF g.546824 m.546824 type:complete len:53 (-) comp22155_c0_seq30:5883-6041(-)